MSGTAPPGDDRTVLLVGASGNLGRATIPRLVEAGWRVRAMSRTPEVLQDVAGPSVEPCRGDLRDAASLGPACDGAYAVVAAAHAALGNHGSNRPATVDRDGNRRLLDAATAAGVGRFVFVSASVATTDHPVDFFRFKAEAEGFVRASGLPYVILKPGAFMETWAQFVGKPILEKHRAVMLGDTKKLVNYVSVRDVARFVEIALRDDDLLGTELRIGGPDDLSAEQAVEIFENAAGITAKRVRPPRAILGIVRFLARPLVPAVHRLLTMATLPQREDDVFDPAPLLERYPMKMTRLENIAREQAAATGLSRS